MLRNWRQASQENERRYQQLARVWEIEPAQAPPGVIPPRPALSQIIREAEDRRRGVLPLHRRIVAGRGAWWSRVAAAAAVLIVALGLATLWSNHRSGDAFGAAEFATSSTQTGTITLTDGTFVRLAPNSRLRLPAKNREREVWLDGRAYFAVESDSSRPFIVHTRAGDARVLGTHFELRARENDLRLAVVEGRVAVSAGAEEVEVEAGEVSHVRDGSKPSVIKVASIEKLLDWPGGRLVFQSMPLEQVGRELELQFGIRVEITDSAVAQRKVTGWFTGESLDEVVTAVCRAAAVRCSIGEGRVWIGDGEQGMGNSPPSTLPAGH